MDEPEIYHPNREKAESKTTKAIVVALLVASGVLVLAITIGGWSVLQGATMFSVIYALLNFLFAYYISNWRRGMLPVAAGLAVLFGVLAAVAAPSWFARANDGFASPLLDPGMLGLLTVLLIPVQILILAFAAQGFRQRWNVEVEAGA